MTNRYHINAEGVPAICRATKGNCPFGGSDGQQNHFDNLEDAQKAADKLNESLHGFIPTDKGNLDDPYSRGSLMSKFPDLSSDEIDEIQDHLKRETEIMDRVKELNSMRDKSTDEYFDSVQKLRKDALVKYRESMNLAITPEQLDDIIDEKLPPKKPWSRSANYEYHPKVDDKNFYEMRALMSAYTGKSQDTIDSEVKELAEKENISLHDATLKYWRESNQRTDKPIVSLDLETANPNKDSTLRYDNGQLTYVLEIGAIKTYPDGRVEKLDFLNGVPKDYSDKHGTGFEQTHNISVSDVESKTEFSTDESKQKQVMDFINDSVVIAHHAPFEVRQLTNSLRGFRKAVDEGNIEIMDSRIFCKYLVPEAERNTNEALVEAAGMEYVNAHRAYNDAEMTLKAFNRLKDNR